MSLVNWLKNRIRTDMIEKEQPHNRRTYFLSEDDENVRMTLQVQDVPGNAVVMRFDKGDRRPLFESGERCEFYKRCDYMILEESQRRHTAVFIELKAQFERDQKGIDREFRGEKQLRWSFPSLRYLLSVYETDNHTLMNSRKLAAIYYLVAKPQNHSPPNPLHRKRRTREPFPSDHYEGITIHYITKNQIKFRQLKSRQTLPALS